MTPEQPEDVGPVPDWTTEYEEWLASQEGEDEINALLSEAENEQNG